ncbi:MAG TPA: porin [Lacunisphaera sp.]|jgi:phosphate-selective porin OprO/OprP|nr:porin [Lacunisphaera sp.]
MRDILLYRFTPALLALSAFPAVVRADELSQLREQLQALEQRILVLERKQEIKSGDAAAVTGDVPKVTVSDKDFALASADGANAIKLRGLAQFDVRLFFGDHGAANNAFVLRRARIIAEGTFARNFSFQLVPDFGGSSVGIVDANLGIAISPGLQFKVGKLKSPVGLELLESDSWTFFNERSIVTNLVPNRDLGVQASGEVLDGTLSYAAGIFGGVPDGASTSNSDFDNDKDLVGRIYYAPFRNDKDSPWHGLAFGIAGSLGREKSASGVTGGYKTDGQQTFFKYGSTTVSDGQSWRVAPQLEYRNGPIGLLGEFVVSTVNLRPTPGGPKAELMNRGWQIAGGYVLTGEDSSFNGVVPRTNFDLAGGTWGAFEVTARHANLKIDDGSFPLYASPASNAGEASSLGLGLNWYLSKAVALKLDYYQTKFEAPPGAPAVPATPFLRQDEKSLITRFQVSF